MSEVSSVAVIFAASISGMILGLNLSSNAEHKVYGPKNPLAALLRNSSGFGVAFSQVLWLLIVCVAMVAAAVFIMRLGNVYPMSKTDRYTFVVFWFLSVGCAKYLRYCYWKRKSKRL